MNQMVLNLLKAKFALLKIDIVLVIEMLATYFLPQKYLKKIQKIILNGALLNALMRKEESTER